MGVGREQSYPRERCSGFIVVEREPMRGGGQGRQRFCERVTARDFRNLGREGLARSGDEVAVPFVRGPQRAVCVVAFAFFGEDKMHRGDAERGGVAQNVAGGLGTRQADDEGDGFGWRWRCVPDKGKRQRFSFDGEQRTTTARSIDQPGIEGVTGLAFEDGEKMNGARIDEGKRPGCFSGSEKHQVHAGYFGGVTLACHEYYQLRFAWDSGGSGATATSASPRQLGAPRITAAGQAIRPCLKSRMN